MISDFPEHIDLIFLSDVSEENHKTNNIYNNRDYSFFKHYTRIIYVIQNHINPTG